MKTKEVFTCNECGANSPRWQGQCPSCGAWNTLQAVMVTQAKKRALTEIRSCNLTSLEDVPETIAEARSTGMPALDTLLGQGFIPGSAILVGGEPGIGKSTLLLQVLALQASLGKKAVYVSGEESLGQIRNRAKRLGVLGQGLSAIASSSLEEVLSIIEKEKPDLIIVDSVQTLASSQIDGAAGSVSQVRTVASELIDAVKKVQTTLVLVGHVTKEGHIAGPKLLEHMVDTVLYLEGDRQHFSRILRVLKNRFGATDELLVFTMKQEGMQVVEDPSTFFLGTQEKNLSGTALVLAIEGRKPFVVEIQALATKSFLSIPRRTALGFDTNRLNLLLAVMEKKLNINLGALDIYAKISGGLALKDQALDLGLVAAILSSLYDKPLRDQTILWGEVDLNGQLRPVAGHDIRIKQAERLGYNPLIHAKNCKSIANISDMIFVKK